MLLGSHNPLPSGLPCKPVRIRVGLIIRVNASIWCCIIPLVELAYLSTGVKSLVGSPLLVTTQPCPVAG